MSRRVTRRRSILAVVAACVASPVAAQAPADGAKAYVDGIYRRIPGSTSAVPKVRYAPQLDALLKRDAAEAHGEVGAIDANPFCGCQDIGEDYAFTSRLRSLGNDRAQVDVDLRNGGRSAYRIDLVRMPAGWAVADIHAADPHSLVAYLRHALPPRRAPRRR